ncbi:MAG: glucokinase [Flavobacteriales bacterium]|nr:glucokinase [Flavobacteriales bacterium]|tara:strand:+ start:482 stop:1429 length:948 start_codon:yes stop_codon:yes gene_type:complete
MYFTVIILNELQVNKFIGVDIGGTNTKIGIVSRDGELLEKVKYPTADLFHGEGYIKNFSILLKDLLEANPEIKKIGIGVPGLITKDRRSLLRLANIPSLSGANILDQLESLLPGYDFALENDANAACLGEFYFSEHNLPSTFLMVTLGTGIGGAAIIDGKLFLGGNGNGVEIGHMLADENSVYEDYISKRAMVSYVKKKLEKEKYKSSLLNEIKPDDLTAKDIENALKEKDGLARKAYAHFGKWLGKNLVSSMRVLDINTILLGGGVSKTFKYMEGSMMNEINSYLGDYYTKELVVKKASLKNEAGIIGAASLNF